MKPIRVGLVCDLREEGWLSMDLIADMLLEHIPLVAGARVAITSLCPPMTRRWSRLPIVGGSPRAHLGDRLTGRFWDYPRWLEPRIHDFDLFHVVDHSYAHLVTMLPAGRTIVTCNDIDAIRAALPGGGARFGPSRLLASRILDGLGQAAHIACISNATRAALLASHRMAPDRVSVAYLGVHASCSPLSQQPWDGEIERRFGPAGIELLHVGSTIPRKRIDVLLEIFSRLHESRRHIRLVRVGGALTQKQRSLAEKLGVADSIVELPFLDRPLLSALYRRATLLVLPSDREGFGLPIVESMACGTAVVASDIPALREIGGPATTYCSTGDVRSWVEAILRLIRERETERNRWEARRRACIATAARFDWKNYAAEMARLYLQIALPEIGDRPVMARPQAS